ncbi:MAG: hypothetical protein ABIX37_06155 [Gammaproteobacteria bacterium]
MHVKKFLAIYLGTTERLARWEALPAAQQAEREKAGMAGWSKWAMDNVGSTVDGGGPLGKTKRIDPQGITDIRNPMAAYTIVEAESHQAAAQLFRNHPHFMLFPGDAVEVMECLPIPGM